MGGLPAAEREEIRLFLTHGLGEPVMQRIARAGWSMWVGVVLLPLPLLAEPSPESENEVPLVELVARLDHDEYQVRKSAAEALFRRGAEAVEALEQAALQGSLETTHQAVLVLERLYRQGQAEARKAAAEALRRLATGKHPPAARRARLIVSMPYKAQQRAAQARRVLRFAPGGIQVQIKRGGGKNERIMVKKQKGQLEIRRTRGNEEVRLTEDAQGIKLQVTKTQNGKKQTKTYQAKSLEELKKKHPDAYKLYKELKSFERRGNIRRAVGALPVVPVPALPRVLPVPVPPKAVPQQPRPAPRPVKPKAPKK